MIKTCDNCVFCTINTRYKFSCGMLDPYFEKYTVKEYVCEEYVSRPESMTQVLLEGYQNRNSKWVPIFYLTNWKKTTQRLVWKYEQKYKKAPQKD